jgi:hypothetical protein
MCTKVDATPAAGLTLSLTNGQLPDGFYNFNADSFNECSIQKTDGWYKRGTLKSDSAITGNSALYGGLTITEQINKLGTNLGTKDKRCGPIAASCRIADDNIISNYNVSTTAISGNQILDALGKWVTTPWSVCYNGIINRNVTCVNSSGQVVPEGTGNCTLSTKPVSSQPCGPDGDNVGKWVASVWGSCSFGSQARSVSCINSAGTIVAQLTGNCTLSTKPVGSQNCTGGVGDNCNSGSDCGSSTCISNKCAPIWENTSLRYGSDY